MSDEKQVIYFTPSLDYKYIICVITQTQPNFTYLTGNMLKTPRYRGYIVWENDLGLQIQTSPFIEVRLYYQSIYFTLFFC